MRRTAVAGLIILTALGGCVPVRPSSPAAVAPAQQPVVSPVPAPAPADSSTPPPAVRADAKVPAAVAGATPAIQPSTSEPTAAGRPVAERSASTTASGAATAAGKPDTPATATATRPAAPAAAKQKPAAAAPVEAAAQAAPAAPPAPPALDLASLEQRLRDTRAIGLFTKLSLKNQVDELLSQFRAYHPGDKTVPPSQLRQQYDRLLMKVLSALQDGDPPLAAQIWSSRETIWGVLTDPAKFEKI